MKNHRSTQPPKNLPPPLPRAELIRWRLLWKAREESYYIKHAVATSPEFAEAYKKWKAKEIDDEKLLPLLRKHLPPLPGDTSNE